MTGDGIGEHCKCFASRMGSSSLSGPTNRCLDFIDRKINKPIDDLVRLNSVERGPAEPV